MHAGQDLDQRGLARAVVADQRHHFAGVDVEFDVGQRGHGSELLRDPAEPENELSVFRLQLMSVPCVGSLP